LKEAVASNKPPFDGHLECALKCGSRSRFLVQQLIHLSTSGKRRPWYNLDIVKIGYARVSTDDQTLDLQLDALKRVGCKTIYQEHGSGRDISRPQLQACLQAIRAGDTLYVWRLDRLGRNLAALIRTVTELENRKIGFASITENIDTSSSSGRLVFHVFASLAEFERNLIRERTMAGLKAARARGRKGGRKPSLTSKDIKTVRALLKTREMTVGEIAERFNVARSTIYNYI